jgi:hypothetical protein
MNWFILIASDDEEFVTSDNPVCVYSTCNNLSSAIALPNTEIRMPISKNLCFVASWKNNYSQINQLNNYLTRLSNKIVTEQSDNLIISSKNCNSLLALTIKYKNYDHSALIKSSLGGVDFDLKFIRG